MYILITTRRDSGRGAEKEKSQTPINMLGDVTLDAPPGEERKMVPL
jgi:hypothetical protein